MPKFSLAGSGFTCAASFRKSRSLHISKQLSEADKRGVDLGLNDDEVAFYDTLAANNSALQVMGKDNLKVIATKLVTQVRRSVTVDWTLRESARAKIEVLVKRILRKHGYPPDLQRRSNQARPCTSRAPLRRVGRLNEG